MRVALFQATSCHGDRTRTSQVCQVGPCQVATSIYIVIMIIIAIILIIVIVVIIIIMIIRFERVLGPCSDILKRNIQQYNSFVSLSV